MEVFLFLNYEVHSSGQSALTPWYFG